MQHTPVSPVDPGLFLLVQAAGVLGIAADAASLTHQLALDGPATADDVLRAARRIGLRARWVQVRQGREERLPLPALLQLDGGEFCLLGGLDAERALVLRPGSEAPEMLSRAELGRIWPGRALALAKRASATEFDRRFNISWFVRALGQYKGLFGEVLLISFVIQLIALATPLASQVIIDKVLVHRTWSTLETLTVVLLAAAVFEVLLTVLRTYLFAHTTNRVDVVLGARLYDHLLSLPMAYFGARRVGDSVTRVRELENIREFLTGSALTLVIDLVFAVVFVVVMFLYSPPLAWIMVATFPFYIVISVVAAPMFHKRLEEKFARGAENQAFLVETVTGVETVKAMAVEPQMQRRWEEQLAAYVSASFRVLTLGNVASQLVQLVSKIGTTATLFTGALLVIDNRLTVGELVAFNMLAGRVIAPVLRLAQLYQDFHQARISVARLGDILNAPRESTRDAATRAVLPPIRGAITVESVSFRYRLDARPVLDDVSLQIRAGEILGIVGLSGSGKSTLAKLVQRFYVPERGRVLIDGIDLAQVDTDWLRRQIGVVLQENTLFNQTVRDNIALADPTIPFERVVTAARLAGAHDFVLQLPEGYDTMIGERGASLSGGQRQRIAIARALVGEPAILIFDEATSALDSESEQIIQENMRQIAAGRTVLLIAHRLSTLRTADRIITMENGRIVESGTHDSLIAAGGRYARLWTIQMGAPRDIAV